MSPEVLALVREERLLEAAALASRSGDHENAKKLYERACAFGPAAREALTYGDATSALALAAEAGDRDLGDEALARLVADTSDEGSRARERLAVQLETRGHSTWAGKLYEASQKPKDAARAYEKAGDAVRAAGLLEDAHDVVAGARVLEGAMRRNPGDFALHVAYGAMLLRYGKAEHAARALQKVPSSAPQRREALGWLVRALAELGLGQAEASSVISGVSAASASSCARSAARSIGASGRSNMRSAASTIGR